MKEQEIITQARTWLGTKFHHQGRRKHVGVDCIGFIVGVIDELGIKVDDRTNYARTPNGNELHNILEENLQKSDLEVGAIALFKIEKQPQHVGIITDYSGGLGLIHSYAGARMVVEHGFDEVWQQRLISTYKFPD